jgi:hypothetical protein
MTTCNRCFRGGPLLLGGCGASNLLSELSLLLLNNTSTLGILIRHPHSLGFGGFSLPETLLHLPPQLQRGAMATGMRAHV